MRPKLRPFTVDFHGEDWREPVPGDVIRHVGARALVLGYLRVVDVRRVRVKVSRGEAARFRLGVLRLPGKPPEGATFTVTSYPPKPRAPPDRWSPLLGP